METKKKRQKTDAGGMILGPCPFCKGTGKVLKKLPFGANPRAPSTRADRLGFESCLRCNGSGKFSAE